MQTPRYFLFLFAAICLAIGMPYSHAGLININLTVSTESGTGADGNAILGSGTWNRIKSTDSTNINALIDNKGFATSVTIQDSGFPSGLEDANVNLVQKEAWGTPVDLTVTGLIANQLYEVAVYSNRVGTAGPTPDTYTVNGISTTLPKPGAAPTVLPGVENVDYAIFLTTGTATGGMTIQAPWIAGIQIRGLLPGELGPQPDLSVSKSASKAGKGIGTFSPGPMKSQTLSQETTKKRPRRFYVEAVNGGEEVDVFYLMGWWKKKKSKVKVFDNATRANITAQALLQTYRYQLFRNEKRQFKVIVRSKNKKPGKLKTRIGAAPSTFSTARWDLVTLLTEVDR